MQRTITVTVCNICGDVTRSTTRYSLGDGEREKLLDLCDEHGAPLRALLEADDMEDEPALPAPDPLGQRRAARKTAPPRKAGQRVRGTPLMTMEDIEKAKRAAARKRT